MGGIRGRKAAELGCSQRGWEAAPQGPGALMTHNLHKSILVTQTPAQKEEG